MAINQNFQMWHHAGGSIFSSICTFGANCTFRFLTTSLPNCKICSRFSPSFKGLKAAWSAVNPPITFCAFFRSS